MSFKCSVFNVSCAKHRYIKLNAVVFLTVFMVLPACVAVANSNDKAQIAFSRGHFLEAAKIAETVGTSESYSLAAKSLTLYGQYIAADIEKKKLFEQAIELANKAIEANPDNAIAYLELTRALGQHAFQVGLMKAARDNYAGKTREAIENAIRINPNLTLAYVKLGRWHVGIISRIGSLIARATYGARKKVAIKSFEHAVELSPDTKEVFFLLAIGYATLDYKKFRIKVHDLLKRAIELPAKNAHERIIHEEAVKHLKFLEENPNVEKI